MLKTLIDVLALAIVLASPTGAGQYPLEGYNPSFNGEYTGKIEAKLAEVPHISGYLSGYNQGPTDGTTAYRQEIGDIPRDLSPFDARIAVLNCALIGKTGTLYTEAGPLKVVIFDCAGRSDGGNHWMTNNRILAELDWYTWQLYPWLMGTEAALVLD